MPQPRSGRQENLPYSLSRWTDVPGGKQKWAWFLDALKTQRMEAFHPVTGVPSWWSLKPEDTLGLVFWTKDPSNLIVYRDLLQPYRTQVHVTVTGWEEVEKGAPGLKSGSAKMALTADYFGPENVVWRFSPIPLVPDVLKRFETILSVASSAGIKKVYLSFLQENDRVHETRDDVEKLKLLVEMASIGEAGGVKLYLCNEDRMLAKQPSLHPNLASGVCAPPEDFALPTQSKPPSEGCGCVLMVDPFTRNESCSFGCQFCYAADKAYSPKKHNTTKSLRVIP